MTNEIDVMPTFSPVDIVNARAYARSKGKAVGTRGRIPHDVLMEWHNALRPVAVEHKPRQKRDMSRAEYRSARKWAQDNGIDVAHKGRIADEVVDQWKNAGMPQYREEVATVYYRALDKKGRPNGKERIAVVYKDMMPITGRGRPPMSSYWAALDIKGIPVRIVTHNMLINVARNDDGEFVYHWSKTDSKSVVSMLNSNVAIQ